MLSGLSRLLLGWAVAAAQPESPQRASHESPVAVLAVVAVEAPVVAVPLQPVMVVQEVEVTVVTELLLPVTKDETETTCVQEGYAELCVHDDSDCVLEGSDCVPWLFVVWLFVGPVLLGLLVGSGEVGLVAVGSPPPPPPPPQSMRHGRPPPPPPPPPPQPKMHPGTMGSVPPPIFGSGNPGGGPGGTGSGNPGGRVGTVQMKPPAVWEVVSVVDGPVCIIVVGVLI